MSLPVWPANPFPQVVLLGNKEMPVPNVIRTQMDYGNTKARQRTGIALKNYDCELLLKQADYLTFRSFYENDCMGGAQSFTWNEPSTGTSYTFRFLPGVAYENYQATDLWKVTFQMEKVFG